MVLATYGLASLTGGWLGVPSREPFERAGEPIMRGDPVPGADFIRSNVVRTVSAYGGLLPWYERTVDVTYDLGNGGWVHPRPLIPTTVRTRVAPRPGLAWVGGAVLAAGLAVAALAVRPNRARMLAAP